jgi:uncharacterized membrane protein YkgB
MTVTKFFDRRLIGLARSLHLPFARLALFIVFFWFGILKVFGMSPANPLVSDLLDRTMPFIGFDQFIICFGVYEMAIGVACLIPKLVRVSMLMLGVHMVTTMMPLVLLPKVAWSAAFVPTLEGQYIIKNLAIIAVAISIVSQMHHPEDVQDTEHKRSDHRTKLTGKRMRAPTVA